MKRSSTKNKKKKESKNTKTLKSNDKTQPCEDKNIKVQYLITNMANACIFNTDNIMLFSSD